MAHPRAPDRTRHPLRARRRAVRRRRRRAACARADVRRRRHRRPMGDAAAGLARRRRAPPRLRGLRALVGARASLPARARRDPFAAARPPRHQGRQHLHSRTARRTSIPRVGRPAAAPRFERPRADRLRVLAGVAARTLSTPLPIGWQKDYDYQSPRLLQRARGRPRAAICSRREELDWRCDLYSLAAMLRRYLPDDEAPRTATTGWTAEALRRRADARSSGFASVTIATSRIGDRISS